MVCGDFQGDASLFAFDRIFFQSLRIMACLSCQACIFCIAAHTGRWQGLCFTGVTKVVVTSFGRLQLIALHHILAYAVVVLKGEEPTLITPWALGDARSETPMPELTQRAQFLFRFLHCWKRFIDHFNIDAFWLRRNGSSRFHIHDHAPNTLRLTALRTQRTRGCTDILYHATQQNEAQQDCFILAAHSHIETVPHYQRDGLPS